MAVATTSRAFIADTAVNPRPGCALPVERVPVIIRRIVSTLFAGGHADYERIFSHLLRYARADPAGRVATLVIPNQRKLHQQDSAWPCCYATLNTFIRLLCALGIVCKASRKKNCAAVYHLPLVDYMVPPDALAALDNLVDPAYTKNARVRNLANLVKSRLNLLRVDQQESTIHRNQVDLDVGATLDTVQELISSLTGIDAVEKQRIFDELNRARDRLQVPGGGTDGRFFLSASYGNTFSRPLQQVDNSQPVDSDQTAVDALSITSGKQRGDSGGGNLQAGDLVVDSGSFIDSDRDRSSISFLPENKMFVIDGSTPESTNGEPGKLYRPADARSARALAKFIEGHPGNFRSYITLTRKYHPQVVRAAIINMLAHTYFPDLDGDLSADVDGELTGKVGRPRKPGAWVTTCCQAYAQYGIPPVMRVLLRAYGGSYSEIRQHLESLARELPPKQYWMQWQESLLPNAEVPSVSQTSPLTEVDEAGDSLAVREGIPGVEVRALVDQMNSDGRPYGIAARPCQQNGHWEVEVDLSFQGRTSTHRFHSKSEWDQYLAAVQRLPRATGSREA